MRPTEERTEKRTETHGVCLDAISRQAAIDAIANCTNCGNEKTLREYVTKHSLENGWTGGVLDALDAVKDLPSAQPEPPWIPVSERLPEKTPLWKTIGYLATVTCDSWKESRTMYVKWETTTVRGKEVSRWTFDNRLFPSEWCVIAWMPLPEVYKPNK